MRGDRSPYWLKVFSDGRWYANETVMEKAKFDTLHRMRFSIVIKPGLLMWFGQTHTENVNVGATVLRSVFDRACEVEQLPVRGAVLFTGSRQIFPADAVPDPIAEEDAALVTTFMQLVVSECDKQKAI